MSSSNSTVETSTTSSTSSQPSSPAATTTSAAPPPPPTTTSTTPTTQPPPATTTSQPPNTTTEAPSTSTTPPSSTSVTTIVNTDPSGRTTRTIVVTNTSPNSPTATTGPTATPTSDSNGGGSGSTGMSQQAKTAVAVVVPIAAVALLVILGLWFWRKRKVRKEAEDQRRKEVEEYGFNPNADGPTVPSVGGAGAGSYAMAEDTSSGYRGWGSTTLAGSTGRKASTTISSGAAGAFSDINSPVRGNNMSDTRSSEPLMYDHHQGDGSVSPEGEILGAMGPSAAANRGADVRRGPSNASSSYSAAARSDGSGENGIGMAYGGDQTSYGANNNYGINSPYADNYVNNAPGYGAGMANGGRGAEFNGGTSSPVIKDNPARRNTRIENSSHYPQQAAGISQNF